jgi:hypothetical protein
MRIWKIVVKIILLRIVTKSLFWYFCYPKSADSREQKFQNGVTLVSTKVSCPLSTVHTGFNKNKKQIKNQNRA